MLKMNTHHMINVLKIKPPQTRRYELKKSPQVTATDDTTKQRLKTNLAQTKKKKK